MSEARAVVMGRIRDALGSSPPAPAEVPRAYRQAGEPVDFDPVERFCEVVSDYDATVHRVEGAGVVEGLAAVCAERNVALQTIKSLASRRWDGRTATAATWYEPLREQADIDLAAHWVLGRPEAFLLTAGDVEILPRLLDAVERFERRPSDDEMARLAERAELAPLFV